MDALIGLAALCPTFAAFPALHTLDGVCRQLYSMREENPGKATMKRIFGIKDGKGD